MDWIEVEAKLKERALEVAQHLLPQGKREGGEWVCGNLDGQPGRSLKVNVTGKVGVWCDFADSGKGGKTLLGLWMHARKLAKFGYAIGEATASTERRTSPSRARAFAAKAGGTLRAGG